MRNWICHNICVLLRILCDIEWWTKPISINTWQICRVRVCVCVWKSAAISICWNWTKIEQKQTIDPVFVSSVMVRTHKRLTHATTLGMTNDDFKFVCRCALAYDAFLYSDVCTQSLSWVTGSPCLRLILLLELLHYRLHCKISHENWCQILYWWMFWDRRKSKWK